MYISKREKKNPVVIPIIVGVVCCILAVLICTVLMSMLIARQGSELKFYDASPYMVHSFSGFCGTMAGVLMLKDQKRVLAMLIPCVYFLLIVGVNVLVIDEGMMHVVPSVVGITVASLAALALSGRRKKGAVKRKLKMGSR